MKTKKRFLSLLVAVSTAASMITAVPVSVSAADIPVVDEDFTDSTISGGITYSAPDSFEYDDQSWTAKNTWTVENGKLKLFVAGPESYTDEPVHPLSGNYSEANVNNIRRDNTPIELKIPFSGVEQGDVVTVNFSVNSTGTGEDKGEIVRALLWSDFASVYNAEDKAVVRGIRMANANNTYIANSSLGRVDTFSWIGLKEDYAGGGYNCIGANGYAPAATDANKDKMDGTYTMAWPTRYMETEFTMTLDTNDKSIKIAHTRNTQTWADTSGSEVVKTIYFDNDLGSSGYVLFKGYLNTWASGTDGLYNKNATLTFDNIKVTRSKDFSKLPVNITADTLEAINYKNDTTATGYEGHENRIEIINEPGNETNKILALNFPANGSNTNAPENSGQVTKMYIPYSGLGESDGLKVSFRFKEPGTASKMWWAHFGSLVACDATTAYGNGIKNYDATNCVLYAPRQDWNLTCVKSNSYAKTNYFSYWGYANKDNKTNLSNSDTNQRGIYHKVEGKQSWITVTMKINKQSKRAYIEFVDENGLLVSDYVYTINDLPTSGGLYFWGAPSKNNSSGDTTVYFDDFKFEKWTPASTDDTEFPVLTMDSYEAVTASNEIYATGFGGNGRAQIVADPDNAANNVLALNVEKWSQSNSNTASDATQQLTSLYIPYKGLEADENLRISYKYKETGDKQNVWWGHFGSVVTTGTSVNKNGANQCVLYSPRQDWNVSWVPGNNSKAQLKNICYVGFDAANTKTTLAADDTDQMVVSADVSAQTGWITTTITIDRATKQAVVEMKNDEGIIVSGEVYTINDLPENGGLYFVGGPSYIKRATAVDTTLYLDDIKLEAWKPLVVETTNLTATDFDAKTDIELTFANALANAESVKQAISITETATGKPVAPARITAVLDSTNNKLVKISVDGGLKYGKTGYTLKLAANTVVDANGLKMTAEHVERFETKLGDSVYVASATPLSSNSTTVTIHNPTDSQKDIWVVLALYNSSNKLIGMAEGTVLSVNGNTTTESIVLTPATVDGEVAAASVLLWNDSTNLVPYHIPVIVK